MGLCCWVVRATVLQTANALNWEPDHLAVQGDPASGNYRYSIASATDFGKVLSFFGSLGLFLYAISLG